MPQLLRAGMLLFSLLYRRGDQVTEGLAHGQHLNHPQGLLPGLGSHHALLGTAACPGSPGHPIQCSSRTHSCRAARDGGGGQEGLILSLVCSFSPQATSILIASADIPGEESKVLACFRQPLHPGCLLPPAQLWLQAGKQAGGFQSSHSASAAQPSPTRGSARAAL